MKDKMEDLFTLFIVGICLVGFLVLIIIQSIGDWWQKRIQAKKIY
jgi:hypothetical protein